MKNGLHRILVVGAGSIGQRHVRCFQLTGRSQIAIVEPNDTLRQAVAERYSVACYRSLDEAMCDTHDGAVVATPAPSHVPIASRLAEQGVHLLIEKPLAVELAGVEHLMKLVSLRGLVAAVAYVYRAHPALAAMRSAVLKGDFGAPLQLVANCGQHFPTYRPAYRSTYYTDRATGGGAIQDALTHVINAGQWLVGSAERVIADAAHQSLADVTVEDTAHVLARHGNVLASYSLNQYQAPNEVTISVVCRAGTVRFEMHRSRWCWITQPGDEWHPSPELALERDTLFTRQANSFLDAMQNGIAPLCTLDEGLQSLTVNRAIFASLASQAWTPVSLAVATASAIAQSATSVI